MSKALVIWPKPAPPTTSHMGSPSSPSLTLWLLSVPKQFVAAPRPLPCSCLLLGMFQPEATTCCSIFTSQAKSYLLREAFLRYSMA